MQKAFTFFSAAAVFISLTFTDIELYALSLSQAEADSDMVEVYDPFEETNRDLYRFNRRLDDYVLKPAAQGYRSAVPGVARDSISNALRNLGEPINMLNSGLQGDIKQSLISFWRFVINSSVGIAGVFDVAGKGGLPYRKEDFGQTLAVYGVGEGPYLMVPFWGPSNTRDLPGRVIDSIADPFNYWFTEYGVAARVATYAVSTRESLIEPLEQIDRVSLDPYVTIRSSYTQHRLDQIANGDSVE